MMVSPKDTVTATVEAISLWESILRIAEHGGSSYVERSARWMVDYHTNRLYKLAQHIMHGYTMGTQYK